MRSRRGPGRVTGDATSTRLAPEDLEMLLQVTRALAAPFELHVMLVEVNAAARHVLHAERSSVWLYDAAAQELVLEVASDMAAVRRPASTGLIGACASSRVLLNVPDCYADPRFDPSMDRSTGFRSRCSLTLPLIHHDGTLVGVLQVLNRDAGAFDASDERLAQALAAQCAVALARVRETQALIHSARLRRQLDTAREVQLASLPAALPPLESYDLHATFLPAEQTGGDIYDLARVGDELLVVLADATGHGIGAALSVTQMQAMLRMALRCGVGLESAFRQANDQLAESLPNGCFVTAFVGLLDPVAHRLRFLSGGQGPILHFRAGAGVFNAYMPTSYPMGARPITALRPPVELSLGQGDVLVLLSDGVYEQEDPDGQAFGRTAVEQLVAQFHAEGSAVIAQRLMEAMRKFARGAAQHDDVTMLLVRRTPAVPPAGSAPGRAQQTDAHP